MEVNRGKQGFTLIEILIALVVLSVALAGMVPVLIHTTRGNAFGRDTTEGATYAQDKLEELKRAEFADLVSGSQTENGFTTSWAVSSSGGFYHAALVGIEVTTAWKDVQGDDRVAHAFTVRANFGE